MRALTPDLGKYNIRVNAVLPGMIRTDRWEKNPEFYKNVPSRFTPIGEVANGSDVADAVYYFAAYAKNTTTTEVIEPATLTNELGSAIRENELLTVSFLEDKMLFDREVWFLYDGALPAIR